MPAGQLAKYRHFTNWPLRVQSASFQRKTAQALLTLRILHYHCSPMNIDSILASLRQEQQRIAQAISALEGLASTKTTSKRGRAPRKRRPLSAAARKSIAAAQRKRWRIWKAKQK